MASITTISPFVNGTAMVAGIWNTKYDLLYNTINGLLDNANFATTAGILESKVNFSDIGHDHSISKAINIASSINTSGANKGDILYYNGTTWATISSGAEGQKLKVDFDPYTKLVLHGDGTDSSSIIIDASASTSTVTQHSVLDSYNKLLMHFENNATDSATSKTVTNNNVTYSTTIYKFGSYSAAFNGSNAYYTLADDNDWNFGSSDFTIDAWIYLTAADGASYTIVSQATDVSNYWRFQVDTNNLLFNQFDGITNFNLRSTNTLNAQTWYHVAVAKSGNIWNLYINGQSVYTTTNSITLNDQTDLLHIGALNNASLKQYFKGNIDELRISKGIARWATNFTSNAYAYGGVYISTQQKKFGSGSLIFQGDGFITLNDSDDWSFGASSFALDTWVQFTSLTTDQTIVSQYESSTRQFYVKYLSGNSISTYHQDAGGIKINHQVPWSPLVNTWYHLAGVRSSSNYNIYINGSTQGTFYNVGTSTMNNLASIVYIGATSGNIDLFQGYIDEMRLSKGVARYATAFTPSTSAYETLPQWE